jgi:endoglucanase
MGAQPATGNAAHVRQAHRQPAHKRHPRHSHRHPATRRGHPLRRVHRPAPAGPPSSKASSLSPASAPNLSAPPVATLPGEALGSGSPPSSNEPPVEAASPPTQTTTTTTTTATGTQIQTTTTTATITQTTTSTTPSTSATTSTTATTGSATSTTTTTTPAPPPPPATSNPFAGAQLYVEPNSPADRTQAEWAKAGRSAEAAQLGKIASQPLAKWFGSWSYGHGGTAGDVNWWVGAATAAGRLPVLVAYDIPWRDCSQYSSGGAASAAAYEQFIEGIAQGIGGRPAVVILEPDALAELECLSAEKQATYYSLLSFAVSRLGKSPSTAVYLDAGNAHWQSAATMATRLRRADVAAARGFSLNVSNFDATASETTYGEAIAGALGGAAHFVIDTSRNGQGRAPEGAWCNPPGRGLGTDPTAHTGKPLIDAYLWVKTPGASDGTCNGGPAAGTWWPEYALGLAQRAAG